MYVGKEKDVANKLTTTTQTSTSTSSTSSSTSAARDKDQVAKTTGYQVVQLLFTGNHREMRSPIVCVLGHVDTGFNLEIRLLQQNF